MSDTDLQIFAHPAAVISRARPDVEHRALAEDFITKYSPYFFSAEVSNSRLDSHYTRMAVSTLRNYAADAQAGVAFLYSHNREELIGKSIGGQFVGGQGNGVSRVVADFYTVPGLQLGTVSSDQIIRALDTEILSDVSVGFYGGRWVCSVCGRDVLRDWDCFHIPGYPEEVEGDGRVETVIAEATVEDAHMAETSGVFDGSTPGAAVVKARQEAEAGRIRPDARRLIEVRYRIHLPEKRVTVPGHKETREVSTREAELNPPPGPEEETPPTPPAEPPADPTPPADQQPDAAPGGEDEREVSALLTRAGVAADRAKTPLTALRLLADECERLKPLADDGTRYRERLRERVIQEQVRAFGRASESFKSLVARATVLELEGMMADLGAKGDEVFAGGRQTVDGTDLPGEPANPGANNQPQRAAHSPAYMT